MGGRIEAAGVAVTVITFLPPAPGQASSDEKARWALEAIVRKAERDFAALESRNGTKRGDINCAYGAMIRAKGQLRRFLRRVK